MAKAHADLRGYIDALEAMGEVQRVRAEVDWNQEIGAITRRVCETRSAAPLFESIKGYPGHRMAGALMGPGRTNLHARVAVGLGLDPAASPLELIEILRERFRGRRAPETVGNADAPCKEVIQRGKDVNLLELPVPLITDPAITGGRYIASWAITITKDPDSGWVNWGMYRMMLVDERRIAAVLVPDGQHGGRIHAKYRAMGKPMPMAIVIGPDPCSSIAAMAPLAHGVSEVDAAGALLGGPVPLVKCETNDLLVPATAEIVVEVEVHPTEKILEGPFGEYTGHIFGVGRPEMKPVATATCLSHRKDPIFTVASMGKPWDDWHVPGSLVQSAILKDWLEAHGVSVGSVYHHAPLTSIVIGVTPRPGLLRKITNIVMAGDRFMSIPATGIIFVEEDVDVTSLEDVWWSIQTRMHPRQFEVIDRTMYNPCMPYGTPEERERKETTRWVMNATFPTDWSAAYKAENTRVVGFNQAWSKEVQDRVLSRWSEYGFPEKKRL